MNNGILTVTVNPAIDKTYVTDRFLTGDIARAAEVFQVYGGKGLNVLRALNAMGFEVAGTGMLGGWEGSWIAEELSGSGLTHAFHRIAGRTRMTHTILESGTGTITELREPGPTIDRNEAEGFLKHIKKLSFDYGHITLSGSLAPGLDVNYYSKIAACVGTNGCKVYVDTGGDALHEVLKTNVHLIKINEQEFLDWLRRETSPEEHLGTESCNEAEIMNGIRRLRDAGCEIAVVTFGAKGSYACDASGVWRIDVPHIRVVNTVGSGDAFLAGLVGALSLGSSLPDACVLAAAAAASNALHPVAGQVDLNEIEVLRPQVSVRKIT